ncbi:MAG: hypothetical protein PUJ40_04715 [bacterium]|nr:hypothetical protein [bacterium]
MYARKESIQKIGIVHHLSHHRKTVNKKYAFSIVRQLNRLKIRGKIVVQIFQKSKKVPMTSTLFAQLEHDAGEARRPKFQKRVASSANEH